MARLVVDGASLQCSMGMAPATLTVLPSNLVEADEPAATVQDHLPMANIAPFGMCQSLANPQVAAATSAAMGTLTPAPCFPQTSSPWSPGSAGVTINDLKALTDVSTCTCLWAGTISITDPKTTVTDE